MPRAFKWRCRLLFRPQFSTRFLLALTTVVALWLGLVVRRAGEQRTAVSAIREQGGTVYYDFQEVPRGSGRYDSNARFDAPAWLTRILSEDLFADVVYVDLWLNSGTREKSNFAHASVERAVPYLPALRKLRRLVIGGLDQADEALAIVGTLSNLEELMVIDASRVTDAGVAHLATRLKLKRLLLLGDAALTDDSLAALGSMRSLEALQLDGSRVTDLGLVHLRAMTSLRMLGLARAGRITDDGMPSLGALVNLEQLDLSGNSVTYKGMQHLAWMTKLRVLHLSNNNGVADQGVCQLAHLVNLEELRLRNTNISSHAVLSLGGHKKLQMLDLSENTGIDQRAVPALRKLVALKELDIHDTAVKLTESNSRFLRGLSSLGKLNISGTGSDVRSVEEALPGCFVVGSAE